MALVNDRKKRRSWGLDIAALVFVAPIGVCLGQYPEPSPATGALMNETVSMLEVGLRELKLRTDPEIKNVLDEYLRADEWMGLHTGYKRYEDLITASVHIKGVAQGAEVAAEKCSEVINLIRPIVRRAIESENVFSPSAYKSSWARELGTGLGEKLAERTQVECWMDVETFGLGGERFESWMDARSMLLSNQILTTNRGDESR